MNNVYFGLQAIFHSVAVSGTEIIRHQLVWGFCLGLLASTCIHALVISKNPRHIPHMIYHQDSKHIFYKLHHPQKDGTYKRSFEDFQRKHHHVRSMFFGLFVVLLLIAIGALLRY